MVGTFKRIAYKKLDTAQTADIDTGEWVGDYDRLKVRIYLTSDSGNQNPQITFNNTDSGYGYKYGIDNANGSDVNGSNYLYHFADDNGDKHITMDIINIKTKEKNVFARTTFSVAGDNYPKHGWLSGKWSNTSSSINRIELKNNYTGNFGVGSYIVVFGASADTVSDEKQTLADATVDQSATQSYNSATTNVTLSNSNLTATSTSTAWGNRAYSTLSYNPSNLTSGQTYEFKFTMGDITKNGFMGFDKTPTTISGHGNDNNSSGVDYGFYLVGNGSSNNYLTVSEQGTEKWQSSSNFITSNTIFKITVDSSGVVKYYADATDGTTLRYTSGTAMSGDFYVLFYPYDSGFTTTITSWSNGLETVSTAPEVGTRYEEVDTRKIYRFKESDTLEQLNGSGNKTIMTNGNEAHYGIKINTGSDLVGKVISKVHFKIKQNENPTTENLVYVRLWRGSSFVHTFGTTDPDNIAIGTYTFYSFGTGGDFSTSSDGNATLQAGDRIVLSWDRGGSYNNTYIHMQYSTTSQYEGTSDSTSTTVSPTQESHWNDNATRDVTFKLEGSSGSVLEKKWVERGTA